MSALPVYHPHPTPPPPPFQNPGSAPAWGPIKVTIPSSYRWKYAPLWLINHPRRLELDSLFLPWYRQPNHTLYIAVADPGGGGDRDDHPPPLELVPILKTYAKCAWPGPITPPPPWNVDDVTRALSKGGGGGACECPRVGVFFNFSEGVWRHADNVQGGGGCLWMSCECLWMSSHPPPRKSCIRACIVFHPSKFRPPPPTWMAGYGPVIVDSNTVT